MLEHLTLWMDPVVREGPEAMAVDEWILENVVGAAILRVYRWDRAWGSLGYFGKLAEAQVAVPGLKWVRRLTGGGLVDHRDDWTYTLAIPAKSAVSRMKGAESYRWIHSILAETLRREGMVAALSDGKVETGASLCFQNPVNHDIVNPEGIKLAGAGQRRTQRGLLHQGSVAGTRTAKASLSRAISLARALCHDFSVDEISIPRSSIMDKVEMRYGLPSWTHRR
jgi:lipoate-protein ligase A